MSTPGFDFDARAAERELAGLLAEPLEGIRAEARPEWGRMSPQAMVEHLEWTFRVSLGEPRLDRASPEVDLPNLNRFLRSGRPFPQGVVLPGLEELPEVVHPDLPAARAALRGFVDRFLDPATETPEPPAVHPVFGALDRMHWLRFHLTHVRHHLAQFGVQST